MARLLNRAFREPKQIRGVLWISYSAAGAGASSKKAGSKLDLQAGQGESAGRVQGDQKPGIGTDLKNLTVLRDRDLPAVRQDSGRLLAADCQEGPFHPVTGKAQENDRTPFRAS